MNKFFGRDFVQAESQSKGSSSDRARIKKKRSLAPGKRRIFYDCVVKDFNLGLAQGTEVDATGSMSLYEVITRFRIEQSDQNDVRNSLNTGLKKSNTRCFMVEQPNKYEVSENSKKIVEINIRDIMFNDIVCTLA